jgi:predicted ATPase
LWDVSQTPIDERLRRFLAAQSTLLVLDNLEQVAPAAPHLAHLLAACPRLAMLVTSRSVLHLSGEHVVPLAPLALPDTRGAGSVDAANASAAVRLFVERARAARVGFDLTADNAADVIAICRHVDGLPLAIELAAARVAHLPPRALAARLKHGLALLTGGARDAPPRLRAMRDAIAWSYDLLTPEEQRLFRRLCVFVNGFPLSAVEAMSWDAAVLPIDSVGSLIDQSLVQPMAAPAGEPRFLVLQTTRRLVSRAGPRDRRCLRDVVERCLARRVRGGVREPARRHGVA